MNSLYKTASFYVSSGNDNSLRVAGWMQKIAADRRITTQRAMIDKRLQKQHIKDSAENLVCIFMPAHGFTAPWSVIKFAGNYLGINFQYSDSLILRFMHYAYYLGVWFIYSKLIFWFARIPVINRILNYTTLTVFYRRYREPTANLLSFNSGRK